jgi:hypothetical protein
MGMAVTVHLAHDDGTDADNPYHAEDADNHETASAHGCRGYDERRDDARGEGVPPPPTLPARGSGGAGLDRGERRELARRIRDAMPKPRQEPR